MSPIDNILVIVDPTANTHPAVQKGAILAEKLSARLELFICDTNLSVVRHKTSDVGLATAPGPIFDPKEFLETLAQPLRERGLDVCTETTFAAPLHAALVKQVKSTCADLVIKDTHPHSLAQRTLLTNTDWELIRHCPVALLLVKPTPWPAQPRIMAAVDPGHTNDKPALLDHCILDQASALSTRLGGELHVAHSYMPVTAGLGVAFVAPGAGDVACAMFAGERDQRRNALADLLADYSVPPANIHLELGPADEAICRTSATVGAEIVCMGAIARNGWKRVLIGSTAEQVLEHLPCDALIVKTPDFAELLPI